MNRLKALRESKGMTQSELGKLLNVKDAAISKYESEKIPLTADTIMRLTEIFSVSADYILGLNDCGAGSLASSLGYSGEESDATTFPHKLALQIDYECSTIHQLAETIHVPDREIIEWLLGKSTTYQKYYKELSAFFNVDERYWNSPGAISPTIEPTLDEYLLIISRRDYLKNGKWSEYSPTLASFFPGMTLPETFEDNKVLSSFKNLNEDNKDIIIGKIKELLKEQVSQSVAADGQMRKASGK